MSHAESLPVVFIDNELQHVNKHTNKSLEEKKLKTQCNLAILSHAQCARFGGHNQQASAATVQHQQERDRIQQEHFNREGNIAYFQHIGITPSLDITRTGALRPALRANAQRIQLLHAATLLQGIVRRRLVRASTAGTRLRIEAVLEQLELIRMRHAVRHSHSQRSVLQCVAATTIQRAWRRRGVRLALQQVPANKLVQSTSQVVRGCVSFFKSCVQQASKVLTRVSDAPALAMGTVATITHFISASRQLQQQIKARQQAVIAVQATVRRRLAKAQHNCSVKGWRHCVPLTDRMIQGYTLAQLVKCSREAVTLQPACEPVAGVSIFTKRQAPTTNGGWQGLVCPKDTTDQYSSAQRFRTVNGSLTSLHTAYDPETMQYDPKKMPSQHRGFIRLSNADQWLSVKILVDTGSQQPNLIATRCAQKIRCQLQQPTQGAASQAGGVILTTEEVRDLQLAINDGAVTQIFYNRHFRLRYYFG